MMECNDDDYDDVDNDDDDDDDDDDDILLKITKKNTCKSVSIKYKVY